VKGRDRISVHEDTDGDGRYDKHLVFQDGLNLANSAVTGRGGVWIMHTPHLLFYPDKDDDAVPDGPPEVRLTGFGLEDSHSVSNGLVWGMDGWLYGGQGSTCSCRVTRPGIDPPGAAGAAFEGCMVWRYHPDTRAFEIFAEGSGNTFGLELDGEGRLFSGHNGGETRGWHYVQGGFYLKQGKDPGKFGPARYPWAFGDLPMMRSTTPAARFTHFFAVGEGTALPSSFQDRIFAVDPLHNVVIAADRRRHGATFETADIAPALKCHDTAFRPVFIVNAPDGSLLVADFYDHYIAHGQHYQSQIDASTGRIYRLRGKDAALERDVNLNAKSGPELVALLSHPNKWHRQTAVRLLGERRDPATRQPLIDLLRKDAGIASAGALWSLYQAGWLEDGKGLRGDGDLLSALHHPVAVVRQWAVRLEGDRSVERYGSSPGIGLPAASGPPPRSSQAASIDSSHGSALAALARTEPDAEVRAGLACSARRLPVAIGFHMLVALALHDEDARDPFIPNLIWYALEHHLSECEKQVLQVLSDPAMWSRPVISMHLLPRLMRRLTAGDNQKSFLTAAALLDLAPDNSKARPLLDGFNEAVQGRDLSGMPPTLMKSLAARGGMTLPLRLRNGEAAAVTEAIALLRDAKAKPEERTLCIRTLGEMRAAAALPALLDLATDTTAAEPLRRAALAAVASFDDDTIPPRVLKSLPATAGVNAAAFATLISRPRWAAFLLKALEAGAPPPASVPLEIVESLRAHPDKALTAAAAKLFPPAGAADWQKEIAAVEAALNEPGGNPYQGEAIYTQRCAGCHQLFHKGGVIGPDLTLYQRDNLGTMLVSIVNPNAEIREGFACQIVETTTGQITSGYILESDPNVLRIRTLDGQTSTLPVAEVKSLTPLGRSLMPDGLLAGLTDGQLRDLFAWLRQSQPISK
jgi:putative membrane-bound dehydrogenase-like protein